MEAKMRHQTNQEILNGTTIRFVQDETGITLDFESYRKDQMIMLLKFWGNDYPYLENTGNCVQECLPIPENSAAQHQIRRLAGYLPVK
jgi:hypothetical protein